MSSYDAVVVGSGPNGLSAAITLAQTGRSVLLLEAKETIGGGLRTAELTLPGFIHDHCAAIFPLSLASPFLRSLDLSKHGLEWVYPQVEAAHPLDGNKAVIIHRSLEKTAEQLGNDGKRYHNFIRPLLDVSLEIMEDILGPLPLPPQHITALARFTFPALLSAKRLAMSLFRGEQARAMFAGHAGHSILPLESPGTGAAALVMSLLAHSVGWPFVRGGSQNLANALLSYFYSLGGEVKTGFKVESMDQLPTAPIVLLDLTPRQFTQVAGERLPNSYRQRLSRFRYGAGVFKVDYALDGPVQWEADECGLSATVHLGGSFEEIRHSERMVWEGKHPERPYVLFVQQSNFDTSRAPNGKHTAWAYCHVPNGSTVDMSAQIESQIERFAPGFQDLILARHTYNTKQLEEYNENNIGGDILGGVQDLRQLYFRPTPRLNPYSTPLKGVFLCSSSTPPGGGAHGMCGYYAAQAAIKNEWRKSSKG